MNLKYEVKNNNFNTLKDLLKNYFFVSDRLICKLKRENRLKVNNDNVYINYILKQNDKVDINIDFEEESENIIPKEMKLNILYEDEAILIIDKEQGISVHPSQGNFDNNLASGVKFYFDKIGLKRKIRIINRLDKDTMRNCNIC